MNEPLALALAGGAGLLLGAVFFGGLWWTVNRGLSSPRPAVWFLGSFLLRMGLIVAGFYFVSGGHWERLLACAVGFLAARLLVTWATRPPRGNPPHPAREARHATESR